MMNVELVYLRKVKCCALRHTFSKTVLLTCRPNANCIWQAKCYYNSRTTRQSTSKQQSVLKEEQQQQQQHSGIFQNMHVNPFPIRAAIDIGTGGVMSLSVGRVDAANLGVMKLMYQTQLPLLLESTSPINVDEFMKDSCHENNTQSVHSSSTTNAINNRSSSYCCDINKPNDGNLFNEEEKKNNEERHCFAKSKYNSANKKREPEEENMPNNRKEQSLSFTLSPRTITDIISKFRLINGAMKRFTSEAINERVALLSWPLCDADNAEQIAEYLTEEFKCKVYVLQKEFTVEWPYAVHQDNNDELNYANVTDATEHLTKTEKLNCDAEEINNATNNEHKGNKSKLKMLLAKKLHIDKGHADSSMELNTETRIKSHTEKCYQQEEHDKQEQMELEERCKYAEELLQNKLLAPSVNLYDGKAAIHELAFLGHASLSTCIAPQRMLVVHEDPTNGICLIGTNTSEEEDVADLIQSIERNESFNKEEKEQELHRISVILSDLNNETKNNRNAHKQKAYLPYLEQIHESSLSSESSSELLNFHNKPTVNSPHLQTHYIGLDARKVHKLCIVAIQRRAVEFYNYEHSSPNPMLIEEYNTLVEVCTEQIASSLPVWVRRKSMLGGVITGTSLSNGMLNCAARVSQQSHIALDHLHLHSTQHFCQCTDVLLQSNFQCFRQLLPSVALVEGIMRALHTPRLVYIPELTPASALLTQPSLWLYSQRHRLQQTLIRSGSRRNANMSSSSSSSIKSSSKLSKNTTTLSKRVFARPPSRVQRTAAPHGWQLPSRSWDTISYENSMIGT